MAITMTMLQQQFLDLQYEVAALSSLFAKFRGYVNNQFDQVRTRLDKIEGRMEIMEGKIGTIEAAMITKDDLKNAVQQLTELIVKYNRG